MQGLPYCCSYFENLRIKSTVFLNFRSYLCHALRGQFLKRKSKKYVFAVWITCPSCISYETAMLNDFCRKNGNKLMHYANNTHEIPFLMYSDALCGGFRKLRLQENYIWKQPESCDASTSLAESSYQRRSAAQWEYAKATRRWQHWHPLPDSCMLWWIYPRELDWIEENYIGKGAVKKSPLSWRVRIPMPASVAWIEVESTAVRYQRRLDKILGEGRVLVCSADFYETKL